MSIVIMGDIVNSSGQDGKRLMEDFKKVVAGVNEGNRQDLLSPLTITLGDEFQGIAKGLDGVVKIIFNIERELMFLKKPFKIRYVVHQGKIETPINKERAYEMLGPGLTTARTLMEEIKTEKKRYVFSIDDKTMEQQLNLMFKVAQGIEDNWTPVQQRVVAQFLKHDLDYRKVAEALKKDASTMWRRRKTLLVEEYNSLKILITHTTDGKWHSRSK